MENTISGDAAVAASENTCAADTTAIYPNGAKPNTSETLPGELGTPHERIQLIQTEIRNAIAAGMKIRYGNIQHDGVPCLVIWIENATLVKGSGTTFEYVGNIVTRKLPETEVSAAT